MWVSAKQSLVKGVGKLFVQTLENIILNHFLRYDTFCVRVLISCKTQSDAVLLFSSVILC